MYKIQFNVIMRRHDDVSIDDVKTIIWTRIGTIPCKIWYRGWVQVYNVWWQVTLKKSVSSNYPISVIFLYVFRRTVLMLNCIWSTASPSIWNRPTISPNFEHVAKCLLMALFLSDHPCSLVLLKRVDSVLLMYEWELPGQQNLYTRHELLRGGILSLLDVKNDTFVVFNWTLNLMFSTILR